MILQFVVGDHHVGVELVQRAAEGGVEQRRLALPRDVAEIGDDLERLAVGVDDRVVDSPAPTLRGRRLRQLAVLALATLAALCIAGQKRG